MRKTVLSVAALALLFLLAGCSSGNPSQTSESAKPAAPKTPDALTGREVFQKLYIAARGWTGDIKPFRLQSEPMPGVNGQDGKAAIWRASFASPARRGLKTYLWSGTDEDGTSRGVTAGTEDTYNPNNRATEIFDVAFLKTDSDKAFSVAQQHGGEKITKANPSQPVIYVLDWNPSENELIWHVIYGSSTSNTKLAVDVDATTGAFLRVEK